MEILPAIVQVVPGNDFTVYAYCNDGAVRLVDMKPMIAKGGVFAPLSDPDFFQGRLMVLNDTVAWDTVGNRDTTACIDLDPCQIFETALVVGDPLEEAHNESVNGFINRALSETMERETPAHGGEEGAQNAD